jgi:hypothetical protein
MQNLKSKAGTIYFGEDTAPRIVAIVQKWEGSTAQQRVALATLAAAAPELLEALETVERWFVQHSPSAPCIDGIERIHPMLEMVRAAIAKATGEEGAL